VSRRFENCPSCCAPSPWSVPSVWLCGLSRLRSCGGSSLASPIPVRALRRYSADQLGWALRTVSRHVPRATGLVQALGLYILLRREGLQSRIQIGVTKDAGRFEADAWVQSQDRVVIGDSGLQRSTPMMVWE
jgi:hypothetical protein